MYSIVLSETSKKYLEDLKIYVKNHFGESVKTEVLDKEKNKLENLQRFPYMGIKAGKFSNLLSEYYVLVDKHEYIFYHVDENRKVISIELILSTKEELVTKIRKYFE